MVTFASRLVPVRGLALLLLLLAGGCPATGPRRRGPSPAERRAMERVVVRAARRAGVPADLLLAVASVESDFDRHAVSRSGAVGLLQLMPATAAEMSGRLGLDEYDLRDPEDNAALGAGYLARMLRHFDGDVKLSLAAYHAGPGCVSNWLEQGLGPDGSAVLARCNRPDTRKYVRKVLARRPGFGWAAGGDRG